MTKCCPNHIRFSSVQRCKMEAKFSFSGGAATGNRGISLLDRGTLVTAPNPKTASISHCSCNIGARLPCRVSELGIAEESSSRVHQTLKVRWNRWTSGVSNPLRLLRKNKGYKPLGKRHNKTHKISRDTDHSYGPYKIVFQRVQIFGS